MAIILNKVSLFIKGLKENLHPSTMNSNPVYRK
jgi:hypothetical protein